MSVPFGVRATRSERPSPSKSPTGKTRLSMPGPDPMLCAGPSTPAAVAEHSPPGPVRLLRHDVGERVDIEARVVVPGAGGEDLREAPKPVLITLVDFQAEASSRRTALLRWAATTARTSGLWSPPKSCG
jgi:hypothetical protein